jgi:hypothetical protein
MRSTIIRTTVDAHPSLADPSLPSPPSPSSCPMTFSKISSILRSSIRCLFQISISCFCSGVHGNCIFIAGFIHLAFLCSFEFTVCVLFFFYRSIMSNASIFPCIAKLFPRIDVRRFCFRHRSTKFLSGMSFGRCDSRKYLLLYNRMILMMIISMLLYRLL